MFAGEDPQFEARRLVEELALAPSGARWWSVTRRSPAVADAYCARAAWVAGVGCAYGTLLPGVQAREIIDRALPV